MDGDDFLQILVLYFFFLGSGKFSDFIKEYEQEQYSLGLKFTFLPSFFYKEYILIFNFFILKFNCLFFFFLLSNIFELPRVNLNIFIGNKGAEFQPCLSK
eukprot:TRINITY_DN18891_c0_g1_i1.p1 TRINITY_DN18891_c0_g1~~TRINITY_DN18891_c0_g1_i1.p1  ORF type:complete len:100 (+),score=3.59 TRINITY_DN18891_c0_g1_i1:1-300(+)